MTKIEFIDFRFIMSEEIENGRNIRSRGGLVNRIKKFKCLRPVAQRKWGDCVTSVWLVELYVAERVADIRIAWKSGILL